MLELDKVPKAPSGFSEDPNGFEVLEVDENIEFLEVSGNLGSSLEKDRDPKLEATCPASDIVLFNCGVFEVLDFLADSKFVPLLSISCLDQIFHEINCPLLVNTIILGNGSLSSTPLHGSLTLTVEFKSRIIPKGVSSSSLSSGIGIIALS